jgi:hypothetical protein
MFRIIAIVVVLLLNLTLVSCRMIGKPTGTDFIGKYKDKYIYLSNAMTDTKSGQNVLYREVYTCPRQYYDFLVEIKYVVELNEIELKEVENVNQWFELGFRGLSSFGIAENHTKITKDYYDVLTVGNGKFNNWKATCQYHHKHEESGATIHGIHNILTGPTILFSLLCLLFLF